MSSLDKSLDDIIKSKKSVRGTKAGRGASGKVGKKVGSSKKKPIVSFRKPTPAVPRDTAPVDMSYATKVVVYGLPRDIKSDAIKDFFQSQVGSVQNVALAYNEKGQFKGIATIIFRTHKSASLAVEKYNGAPIDGGSSKLKLELIIDPTKKPLTSRIAPNKVQPPPKVNSLKGRVKSNIKNKQNKVQQKNKPAKRGKKTVEQLDQEMSDYFDN